MASKKKWIVRVSDGFCVYAGNPERRPDLVAPDYEIISIPQPTEDHVWDDVTETWVASEVLAEYRKREKIRAECNRILNTIFCYSCHQTDCRNLTALGESIPLPYTDQQMTEILKYRNSLRAFPDDPNTDLNDPEYPEAPNFI